MFHSPTYTAESLHRAHKERQARMARNAVPDDGIIHPRQRKTQYGVKWSRFPEIRKSPPPPPIKEVFEKAAAAHPLPEPFVPEKITLAKAQRILRWAEKGKDSPFKTLAIEGAIPTPVYPKFTLIMSLVCEEFKVSHLDLQSRRRYAYGALARQVCMYFGRLLTPLSFPEIGARLGGRDHSTAMHGFHKIDKLKETDLELAASLARIAKKIEDAMATKGAHP